MFDAFDEALDQGTQAMILVVFRSRLRPENAAEFSEHADRMLEVARSMPGFVSYKSFLSDDGERASIIEFEDAEALKGWRDHPEHRRLQAEGRKRFYTEYSLQVSEPLRESRFER